jgi:hypothetical protein
MTDVDFNLRKKALAKEFRLFDDEVTYNPRTHARTVGKISHYLLNGRSTEILKKFRQARNDAPAQTELAEAAAPNDPADKVKKLSGFAVMRYGKVTGDMLLERDRVAKLRAEERADLQSRAAKIRDLSTHDEQFEEIDRIAQRLGPLQANQTSVEAALAKVGYLCARKRLPAVARPSGPYGPEDLTGLGVEVAEARKLNEDKKHQEAYAKLVKVADALAQFKD